MTTTTTMAAYTQVRLFDLHKLSSKEAGFKHHELRNTPLGVGFGNDGHSLVVALRGG